MMTYFVSFLNFDTAHHRSNPLHHTAIIILEGEKNEDETISDLKLIDAYGFYSHEIPKDSSTSTLEKFLKNIFKINFRIFGSYAEFKKEDLKQIDLGVGIKTSILMELNPEEIKKLNETIQKILADERKFFADPDKKAEDTIEGYQISDTKLKKKLYTDLRNHFREIHYQDELKKIKVTIDNQESDLLIEETALNQKIISENRFRQEKLRSTNGINFFEFELSPNGSTCKTMAFDLVKMCLDNHPQDKRKEYVSKALNDSYYFSSLPRYSPHLSKTIFDSQQVNYSATKSEPHLPERQWGQVITTNCIAHQNNLYLNAKAGKEELLSSYELSEIEILMLENLMLLKRLFNDYINENNETNCEYYIDCIEKALNLSRQSMSLNESIYIYHKLLKTINEKKAFEFISNEVLKTQLSLDKVSNLSSVIKKNKIKLEAGLNKEFFRFKEMKKQTNKNFLSSNDLKQRSLFSFFSSLQKKEDIDEIEMMPIIKF